MLFYRAVVDLSRSTLNYVAGIVRRPRRRIGSAWRLLNPGHQALLILLYLRKGETFAQLGAGPHVLRKIAGHGSITTTQRYLHPDLRSVTAAGTALTAHLAKPVVPKWSPTVINTDG